MINIHHYSARYKGEAMSRTADIHRLFRRMPLLPTDQRQELLKQCQIHFAALYHLNKEHLENSEKINSAIQELHDICEEIASFNSQEDHTDGKGICPVCQSPISDNREEFKAHIKGLPGLEDMIDEMVSCETCVAPAMEANKKLEEAFGLTL